MVTLGPSMAILQRLCDIPKPGWPRPGSGDAARYRQKNTVDFIPNFNEEFLRTGGITVQGAQFAYQRFVGHPGRYITNDPPIIWAKWWMG